MTNKTRVLVLGADGFVGRRLVLALKASEWAEPVAGGRRAVGAVNGIERVQLDACNPGEVAAALQEVGGVVNCVAGSATTIAESAAALFSAASQSRMPVPVVHMSSMAVYGSATGRITEAAELRADAGAYGEAKIRAEASAADYAHSVVLRPGIIYGAGSPQWTVRIGQWLQAHRIGDLGAAGDGFANLVHVDDVCTAAIRALQAPDARGKCFNLGSPNPPTWNEYFLKFAKSLGAVPLQRVTARALKLETKLFAPPLKVMEIGLRKLAPRQLSRLPQPIPPSLLGLWRQRIALDVTQAESGLGVKWTELEQALEQEADALKRGA